MISLFLCLKLKAHTAQNEIFLLSVYTLDFSLVFLEHIEDVQWNKAKPLNQWKAAVIS